VVLLLANMLVRQSPAGTAGGAAIPARSIAVLPFDDLSPGHDRGYFSAGMAEELLNALAKVPGLKVAGRASSFYYGGRNADLRTIGKALNVASVLEGSVRSQGDAVRISVQLIRTTDGFEVWSQSYDGDMHDIFDLQERIARAITGQLRIVLAGGEDARLVPVATTSSEAYSKFLQAETLVNQRVGDSLPRAIALLHEATTLDPAFARAWSRLAVAQAVLPQYVPGNDWKASWKASDAAARRALAIDPRQAQAYASLSYNQFSQRHYSAMVEPMRNALALGPTDAAVNYWAANELAAMGRTRAAETRIDAALANDPANMLLLFYKSMVRWRAGDEAGALDYIHRGGTEDSPFGALMLEMYDAAHGDTQGAAREFANSTGRMGTKIPPLDLQAIYLGTYGDASQRREALDVVAAHADDDWAPTLLLQLGEPARAFDLYEHGHSGLSDGFMNWLWQPEPWSRKARRDPVFQGFARRIGMVDYWKRNGWPDLCRPRPAAGADAFACD
jgi:TolB-like protein/tetratricopeptide (TPR) repeat protein